MYTLEEYVKWRQGSVKRVRTHIEYVLPACTQFQTSDGGSIVYRARAVSAPAASACPES